MKSCRPALSISHVPLLTELTDFSFSQRDNLTCVLKEKTIPDGPRSEYHGKMGKAIGDTSDGHGDLTEGLSGGEDTRACGKRAVPQMYEVVTVHQKGTHLDDAGVPLLALGRSSATMVRTQQHAWHLGERHTVPKYSLPTYTSATNRLPLNKCVRLETNKCLVLAPSSSHKRYMFGGAYSMKPRRAQNSDCALKYEQPFGHLIDTEILMARSWRT